MIKYYGQFDNPKVDEYLHKTFFPNKKDGFYIECGAYDGLCECSCKVFKDLGWAGLNIEPDPFIFKRLENNRPGESNINNALSSPERDNQTVEFNNVRSKNPRLINYLGGSEYGLGKLSHLDKQPKAGGGVIRKYTQQK